MGWQVVGAFYKCRRLLAITVMAGVFGFGTGCGPDKPVAPQPMTSEVPTAVKPIVQGQFPDLDKFTQVDRRPFDSGGRPGPGFMILFTVPDRSLRCFISNGLGAVCAGELAGLPNSIPERATPNPGTGRCPVVESGPGSSSYVFGRIGGSCPPFTDVKVLEPGQKLTNDQVSCVVGDGGLVACKNVVKNHGFVLHPSGSWTF